MKKKLLLFVMLIAMLGVCVFAASGCVSFDSSFLITFDSDGGEMEQTTLTAKDGETVDLTKYLPIKENYEFIGWSHGGETVTEITVNEDVTLIALWKGAFAFSCNAETAEIENDVISFAAEATYAGEKADLSVFVNGNELTVGETGLYTATLEKGVNAIKIKADSGEISEEKTYNIDYGGFTLITDLYDITTGDASYTFGADSFYGEEKCQTKVEFEGKTLEAKEGEYTLAFDSDKTYEVTVGAIAGNMRYTEIFAITYDSSLPKFAQMTLAKNKEYRGENIAFTLKATDSDGNKLNDKNVSFYADFDSDDGKDEFTELTSSEISTVWSDDNATSYRLHITEGGFADGADKTVAVKVVLTDGKKNAERLYFVRYVGPDEDGCIGEIVVSIDGFTVGVGYILEPTVIKVYKDVKFPVYLDELIKERGWEMEYTGSFESGFYLSYINGLDIPENKVNSRLAEALENMGMSIAEEDMSLSPEKNGTYNLGEFCYNYMSGWMYSINGLFANYGMADYEPIDGDVVQLRFTLAYGGDIGGGAAMGGFAPTVSENDSDYCALNALVAKIIAADYYGKGREKLDEVFESVTEWDAAQSVVDEAAEALKNYYL